MDRFEAYFISVVHVEDFAKISKSKSVAKFYSTFVNSLLWVTKEHNGRLLRTINDDTILYFPDTANSQDKDAIENALESCLALLSYRHEIDKELAKEELPEISYNVSADYGNLAIYSSEKSISFDLFGPMINFCRANEQVGTKK